MAKSKNRLVRFLGNVRRMYRIAAQAGGTAASSGFGDKWASLWSNMFGGLWAPGRQVAPGEAMKISMVYACVSRIAGAISQMPWRVYLPGPDADSVPVRAEPQVERLMNRRPATFWSGVRWRSWMVVNLLLWGNAYAYIHRADDGTLLQVIPIHPTRVMVKVVAGRMVYEVYSAQARMVGVASVGALPVLRLDQSEMIHFRLPGGDELCSPSVLSGMAADLGIHQEITDYQAGYWMRGSQQQFAVISSGEMDDKQLLEFAKSWEQAYGGPDNRYRPVVLEHSKDIKPLGINAEDAQLIQSKDVTLDGIARAFGVPSALVNREQKTTSFGSGVTQIFGAFYKLTLGNHTEEMVCEAEGKLFPVSNHTMMLDPSRLLRGSEKELMDFLEKALGGGQKPGTISPNESRGFLGLPPVDRDEYKYPHVAQAGAPAVDSDPDDAEENTDPDDPDDDDADTGESPGSPIRF